MNFPEVWLSRAVALFTALTMAPWLDAIPELDADVVEFGAGTQTETNTIHIPLENFDVDVLINNTTYPIALQPFTDGTAVVNLDKFQTKVTTLSDDQVMGASYNKIDSAISAHDRGIRTSKFMKAIHALAPSSKSISTPIIVTTGANDEYGRKKMVYADLIALKRAMDKSGASPEGRRLVLSSEHYTDLMEDRDRFANLINNIPAGKLAPMILGFEIYSYASNPYYSKTGNAFTKKVFGSVVGNGDYEASVVFLAGNVAKKTGNTKQYFTPSSQDPETQTNKLNYRHYFIAMPVRNKFMGAVVSGGNATPHETVITGFGGASVAQSGTLTINGTNFLNATGVTIGGVAGTSMTIVSNTEITVTVPVSVPAGAQPVIVAGLGGASNSMNVTVTT